MRQPSGHQFCRSWYYSDVFSSALTHMSLLGRSTQLLHSNLHIGLGVFLFPLTSHSLSLPTFIVEVFPSLACLLLYGWSAVDHMDTPLHFHILLAFLKGFNEKLPIISPDQACLEKESSKWMYHSYNSSTGASNYGLTDQLEDLVKCSISGMTQVDIIWGPLRFIECQSSFTLC